MIFQKIKDMTFTADFVLRNLSSHPPRSRCRCGGLELIPPTPFSWKEKGEFKSFINRRLSFFAFNMRGIDSPLFFQERGARGVSSYGIKDF